jgi:hypothetical protein
MNEYIVEYLQGGYTRLFMEDDEMVELYVAGANIETERHMGLKIKRLYRIKRNFFFWKVKVLICSFD